MTIIPEKIQKAKDNKYDVIVVGSGMSGSWAAKEFCEKGLKTLVLERGRMVNHIEDYPTAEKEVWDFEFRDSATKKNIERQSKQQRTGYAARESIKHWFVDDVDHPYNEEKRFDWIRGYHVGGRSITWGRQALRLSDVELSSNKEYGIATDWPIRYKDLEPWYSKVEEFIGVCGENLGLEHFPDANLTPPMDLNCVEKVFQQKISENYKNRHLTIGRFANITGNKSFKGRSACLYRDKCVRGCPLGGYFSANSSTLPAANSTGNLSLVVNAIVSEVIYDDKRGRAIGVKIIDAETKEEAVIKAKVIFLCASTVASTSILLNSKSKRFPNGLGNDSGELGHNLMDHQFKVGATAEYYGFEDKEEKGRRPASFHIPRFVNLEDKATKKLFKGGYSFQGLARREDWRRGFNDLSYGKGMVENLKDRGKWKIWMTGYGEHLPYHENRMWLNYNKLDKWGLPTVVFDCEYKENERLMREDIKREAVEMFEKAGFSNVKAYDDECFPGNAIHEMGTARMGNDPKTSVLNKYNQIHSVPNVYVTDGSCMVSSGYQNPSLTYMALTARAVDHAVKEFNLLKRG